VFGGRRRGDRPAAAACAFGLELEGPSPFFHARVKSVLTWGMGVSAAEEEEFASSGDSRGSGTEIVNRASPPVDERSDRGSRLSVGFG